MLSRRTNPKTAKVIGASVKRFSKATAFKIEGGSSPKARKEIIFEVLCIMVRLDLSLVGCWTTIRWTHVRLYTESQRYLVSPFGIPRRENGEGIVELDLCVTARTLT